MEKRYNISLTHDQLVVLSVAIRNKMKSNPSACEYYKELMNDILSRVYKAEERAENDIDKYNKKVMEGK